MKKFRVGIVRLERKVFIPDRNLMSKKNTMSESVYVGGGKILILKQSQKTIRTGLPESVLCPLFFGFLGIKLNEKFEPVFFFDFGPPHPVNVATMSHKAHGAKVMENVPLIRTGDCFRSLF